MFDEIVAPTMKELFVNRLEGLILSGALPVGQRLPTERELAEQMRVSKTVIHTGITELQRKGFVEVTPRQGVVVTDYVEHGNLETLEAIMHFNGGMLDRKNTISILEARLYIEGPAITAVARMRDPATLTRLEAIIQTVQELSSMQPVDYRALAQQHYLFHHAICVCSGNTISPLIFNAFRVLTLPFWERDLRCQGAASGVERLLKLLELIRSGDEQGSRDYLEVIVQFSMPK